MGKQTMPVEAINENSQAAGRDAIKAKNVQIVNGNNNIINNYGDALQLPLNDDKILVIPSKLVKKILGKTTKQAILSVLSGNRDELKKLISADSVNKVLKDNFININTKNDAVIDDLLNAAIDRRWEQKKSFGAIMAKSIIDSLKYDKKNIKSVQSFARKAQSRCFYFISAITKKASSEEKTLDYKVAKILKEKLGSENVFWWEDNFYADDELDTHKELFISTKIATGLGFSTIFIGLAFDTTEYDQNTRKYTYKCLMKGDKAYKKPEYFLYEVATFRTFVKDEDNKNSKHFLRKIVKKEDYKLLVPKQRHIRFYTYGEPEDFSVLDNIDNCIDTADGEFQKIANNKGLDLDCKANKIAEIIFNRIREEQKDNKLPIPYCEAGYSYLFKPFDSEGNWDEGQYCDDFLKGAKGYKENVGMVPSDYFFEYAIIDDAGKNAKNHFLIFPECQILIPEQNKDKRKQTKLNSVNFNWRLRLVVRDWNLNAVDPKVYNNDENTGAINRAYLSSYSQITYGVEKGNNVEWSVQEYKHKKNDIGVWDGYYDKQNCTFILTSDIFAEHLDGRLSGQISLHNGKPDEGKKYYFSVNFAPKKIVTYKTGETNIDLENDEDKLKELDVKVASNLKQEIACLKGDELRQEGKLCEVQLNDESQRLRLKTGTKNQSRYLLLKAISDNKDTQLKDINHRCIFCGRILTTDDKLINDEKYCFQDLGNKKKKKSGSGSSEISCSHNFVLDAFNFVDDTFNVNDFFKYEADADVNSKAVKPSSKDKQLLLPEGYCGKNGVVISLVGATTSGKSTFVSSLFGVRGDGVNCEYIGNALWPYVKKTELCKYTTSEKLPCIGEWRLKNDYNLVGYDKCLTPTSNDADTDKVVISHTPFILQLEGILEGNKDYEKAFLSFFDAPGGSTAKTEGASGNSENWVSEFASSTKSEDFLMIFRSDCIVLLVNGSGKNEKTLKLGGARQILKAIDEKLKQLGTIDIKKYKENTLLAVVLCQFDEFVDSFAPESYVRTSPPIANTNNYVNSTRKKYIDICSEEVRSYIAYREGGETAFIKAVEEYEHHKFFAVSSLGRREVIVDSSEVNKKNEPVKKYAFVAKPQNIENILLWIMYKRGIIS